LAGSAGVPAERGRIGWAEGRIRPALEDGAFINSAGLELDASATSVLIFGAGAEGTSDEREESVGWVLIAAAGASETAFGVSVI
jgi:hypothetical protein